MRHHSGLVRLVRGGDDEILLLIEVAEVGHPAPMVIAIGAHEWSQLLAHPSAPQACMVQLDNPAAPPRKAG